MFLFQIVENLLITRNNVTEVIENMNRGLISGFKNPNGNLRRTDLDSYSGSAGFSNNTYAYEKESKEKLNNVVHSIQEISNRRGEISKNIKDIENKTKQFYERAKVIFKELKTLRHERLNMNDINLKFQEVRNRFKANVEDNIINNQHETNKSTLGSDLPGSPKRKRDKVRTFSEDMKRDKNSFQLFKSIYHIYKYKY